MKTVKNVQTGL